MFPGHIWPPWHYFGSRTRIPQITLQFGVPFEQPKCVADRFHIFKDVASWANFFWDVASRAASRPASRESLRAWLRAAALRPALPLLEPGPPRSLWI